MAAYQKGEPRSDSTDPHVRIERGNLYLVVPESQSRRRFSRQDVVRMVEEDHERSLAAIRSNGHEFGARQIREAEHRRARKLESV